MKEPAKCKNGVLRQLGASIFATGTSQEWAILHLVKGNLKAFSDSYVIKPVKPVKQDYIWQLMVVLFFFQAKQFERGQHLQYGNFKAFFRHMLNISQVLASFDVIGYSDCAFNCLGTLACFSFNYAILADNSTGRHVCHLLASDKYNHFSNFVKSDKFHHYAIGVG